MDDSRDEAAARAVLEVIDTKGGVVSSRQRLHPGAGIPFEPLDRAGLLGVPLLRR